MSLAKAALALTLPLVLAYCASLASDGRALTYDAKSVGKPNSGAPLELWLPPGTGPFPAVVVMHSCNGVDSNHRGWAKRVTEWGYAAALIDSFHPRNVNKTCYNLRADPKPVLRAQDAFNAAIYLRTLSIIKPDHIGLLGFSHGGGTAMIAALASSVPTDRGGRPFQALVAFYPLCRDKVPGELASDLLILIGNNDNWAPASDCLKYLEGQSGFPRVPTIKVYPGALHAFDSPFSPTFYLDRLTGRNDEAATDSYAVTKAYFDARLKSK